MYGLSLAKGLIETQAARCVLLLTSDTYSKYIHPLDKSVRTLFGDAAAATAIFAREATEEATGPFVFGTDGAGAKNLIVEAVVCTGCQSLVIRQLRRQDDYGNVRSRNNLYMNGAEVMAFSLKEVPKAADALLKKADKPKMTLISLFCIKLIEFMLEALRKKLKLDEEKLPISMERYGNTVSSSIPIAMHTLKSQGKLGYGKRLMLVGFGVGYSWAACLLNF